MGIQNFSKLFEPKIIKPSYFKNKTVIVDAMYEIYRASNVKFVLTDHNGQSTTHINTLLSIMLSLNKMGAIQYWVFDNGFENQIKILEINKRKERREKAQRELDLFSSDEEKDTAEITERKIKLGRTAFKLDEYRILDTIKILQYLGIPYLIAPKGFEGEQMCANIPCDFVLSPDPDALVFGCKKLVKKSSKEYCLYDLDEILNSFKITMDEFIKICVIMGSDFAPKTPKIGHKTVIKKYKDVELTDEQNKAVDYFKTRFNGDIEWIESDKNIDNLVNWLVIEKSFNRALLEKRLEKCL